MRFNLFPKDEQFFDLYGKMADEIQAASLLLEQLLATDPPDVAKVEPIRDAEHRCDTLTHDAIQRLHRTFVTPFDREDLYALATTLDTVMDAIDHTASLVRLYKIQVVRPWRPRARPYGLGLGRTHAHGPRSARDEEAGAIRTRSKSTGSRTRRIASIRKPSGRCSTPRPTRS